MLDIVLGYIHSYVKPHTHRAGDGGPIRTDETVYIRNALRPPLFVDSRMLVPNFNAELWSGHKYYLGSKPTGAGFGYGDLVWDGTTLWVWNGKTWTSTGGSGGASVNDTFLTTSINADLPNETVVSAYPFVNVDIAAAAAIAVSKLAAGSPGYVLGMVAGVPTWITPPAGAAHNLLDGSVDQDTVVQAAVRGMLIVGNSSPYWAGLALGGAGTFPRSNGTDLVYSTLTIPDTLAQNKLLYASLANILAALTLGTTLGISGGTMDVQANTVVEQVKVDKSGTLVGTRKEINLIPGTGVTLTVTDNAGSDRVDVTINSSGAAASWVRNFLLMGG